MTVLFYILTILAGLTCVYIFAMESILWETPLARKTFKVDSDAQLEYTKPLAYNQGFYNLFLGIGMFLGVIFRTDEMIAIAVFSLFSMLIAALVLVLNDRNYLSAAIKQGALPLITIIVYLISI